MYQLLIVEDEKLLRESLCALVDWESAGVSVAGAVENGVQALRFLEKTPVDLVMTDIRMPVMDGLELAYELQSRYPRIKTVLCSAYSEFSFAQKAIEYGVYGYLLKSQDEEEIAAYFAQLCSKLDKEQPLSLVSASAEENLWRMRERLGTQLFKGGLSMEELAQIRRGGEACKLDLRDRPVAVLLAVLDGMAALQEELGALPMKQLEKVLAEQLLSSFEWAEMGHLLHTTSPLAALWTDFSEGWEGRLHTLHQSLLAELGDFESSFPVTLTLSLGERVERLQDIPLSFTSAKEALSARFYLGGKQLLLPGCPASPLSFTPAETELFTQKAERLCREGDPESLTAFLEEIHGSITKRCITDRSSMAAFASRLTLLLAETAEQRNGGDMSYVSKSGERIQALGQCETADAMFDQLLLTCREFLGNSMGLLENELRQPKRMVDKVLTYLRENFAHDVSLEQAAAFVSVHPVHLSRLFRQETGQTFKNVLTQIRIAEAKSLLADLDLKVYEISERVGYKKPRYFSELFKEVTGMTPLEYREKR